VPSGDNAKSRSLSEVDSDPSPSIVNFSGGELRAGSFSVCPDAVVANAWAMIIAARSRFILLGFMQEQDKGHWVGEGHVFGGKMRVSRSILSNIIRFS